ncbi:HemK family protein methyltransferase [Microbispora hainanensis]|uniref:peptide chain release factor N(5)-glutamine methyltransferase n=1 Tax=Microbispora hainanensis TaxID=568844 RepID=A0A544YL79_9ACTN|nr:HemK family protein methyltransferase [Microbispora hainanensis]
MSFSPALPPIVARLRAAGCVFAEDEARLLVTAARTPAELDDMVDRRARGLPLEHVVGWAEFCGLRLAVDPGVFVPRPRSEFLVRQAIALARPGAVVVDLCCGSGALGAALAAAVGPVELHAVDVEPAAVRCARRNLATVGGTVIGGRGTGGTVIGGGVYEGDLYAALPAGLRGRVDVLLASPPYVPTEAIGLLPPEARVHEPQVALDGGADGLDIVRRVIEGADGWLAPGGHLLVETSEAQARQTADAVARAGLTARLTYDEELDATTVIGTRPGPTGPAG